MSTERHVLNDGCADTLHGRTYCLPADHDDFNAVVGVGRLTEREGGPVTHYTVEATIQCGKCGLLFEWIGPVMGIADPNGPVVNLDRTQLRIPIEPIGVTMRGRIAVGLRIHSNTADSKEAGQR